jgi:uncharacterized membrane protein YccC
MPDSSGLRVSDQQRERVAQAIRDHYAAGRLNEEELTERVTAAYSARTESDLAGLVKDLPKLPISPQQQKAELRQRRSQLQSRLFQEAGGGAIAFVVCTAIWAASGAHGSFWPIWVAVVTLLVLARSAWRLYGPGADLDEVERHLDRRRSQHERHSHRRR